MAPSVAIASTVTIMMSVPMPILVVASATVVLVTLSLFPVTGGLLILLPLLPMRLPLLAGRCRNRLRTSVMMWPVPALATPPGRR